MPLSLTVDGDRWRAHLRHVAATHPGLVPVLKGNGYGIGVPRLARRAAWLGADLVAVGSYEEVPQVLSRYDGDVLVLSPWRPFLPDTSYDRADGRRVVHTVGRPEDLAALAGAQRQPRPRVVLEALTSMRRHGFRRNALRKAAAAPVDVEGIALHLPMRGDRVAEVESWLDGDLARTVFVSHLTDTELGKLGARHPEIRLRPRIGTMLWLGDRSFFTVRATVLDVHPVSRGDRAGYRQRPVPRDGHLLVLAGGTSHGIALEAPASGTSVRNRAIALARGGLDAVGAALSPYVVAGRQRWFLEPPHMQVSMVFLPASAPPPAVGDEVPVQVRYTTTTFDRVTIT
ncbi:MAG: alanine racemase [Actinomycetota bacterium]|nr:alanine racemase [Actinomycetota bacterium]